MSTRSQIKVKGSEVLIYKHSDGYPSEVLPTLVPIMRRFKNERGNDVEYANAQIMRAFARRDEKRRKERYKEYKNSEDEFENQLADDYKEPFMTGWGISTKKHGDIEYFYEVDLKEGVVSVYHDGEFEDGFFLENGVY